MLPQDKTPGTAAPSRDSPAKTAAQSELFFNRLVKRYRHLRKWARRTGTNAFRLYDRDIPEIPLALDFYEDAAAGALYRRPYEKDEDDEREWLKAMKAAAARALGIKENRVFLNERKRQKGRGETGNRQYGRMREQNFYREVREGDLVFRVNLSDYLDTGLFLDARKKRAFVRAEAAGKKTLNLFAYTCSLSAAAAKGGALQVDSVDLSNTYLEWGKINFALNGLEKENRFNFIRADVFRFLREAAERKSRWDFIILDPPSFSNSKKMNGTLDIRRDYESLVNRCLSLLVPGGTLLFSSNAKGFTFEGGNFPGFTVKDISLNLTDEDFKGKKVPFCCTLTKKENCAIVIP